MGNIVDCACETQPRNNDNSLQNLGKKLEVYATNNHLMQFDRNTRQFIEKLFVLNQSHVGDKLMELIRESKEPEKSLMISDLSRINLEQFDEICYVSQSSYIMKNIVKTNTAQMEGDTVKIGQKYIQEGQQCLKKLKFLLIVTAKCFGSQNQPDPFQPTDLLSKKSRIEIFMEKVEAFRHRHGLDYQICLICPIKHSPKYDSFTEKDIQILIFEPNQPCFNSEGKIIMYGNKIQFNEINGDLLHFLLTSSPLKSSYTTFDYINFCDLSNFASPLINPAHLGYLNSNKKISVLATIKDKPKIKIQRQFYSTQGEEFGDILLKTQILRQIGTKTSNLHQILNIRIVRKQMTGTEDCYYFSRLPQDILYTNWSQITKIPYHASNRKEYSNFCKGVLGIQNQNQDDIVEISPAVLQGDPVQFQNILNTLKKQENEISFPIVITSFHQ